MNYDILNVIDIAVSIRAQVIMMVLGVTKMTVDYITLFMDMADVIDDILIIKCDVQVLRGPGTYILVLQCFYQFLSVCGKYTYCIILHGYNHEHIMDM